jgi:uncharacterized protein YodC (DUF2158 family)
MDGVTMEQKIEVGDDVRLRRGGPEMTVSRIDDRASTVTCFWFSEPRCIEVFPFPRRALALVRKAADDGET